MLTHLFYLSAFIAIWYEIENLRYPDKYLIAYKFMKNKKNAKAIRGNYAIYAILMFFYMLWSFIGITSSQWLSFVILITWSLTFPKHLNNLFRRIDAGVSIVILLFILINQYHLHYTASDLLHLAF